MEADSSTFLLAAGVTTAVGVAVTAIWMAERVDKFAIRRFFQSFGSKTDEKSKKGRSKPPKAEKQTAATQSTKNLQEKPAASNNAAALESKGKKSGVDRAPNGPNPAQAKSEPAPVVHAGVKAPETAERPSAKPASAPTAPAGAGSVKSGKKEAAAPAASPAQPAVKSAPAAIGKSGKEKAQQPATASIQPAATQSANSSKSSKKANKNTSSQPAASAGGGAAAPATVDGWVTVGKGGKSGKEGGKAEGGAAEHLPGGAASKGEAAQDGSGWPACGPGVGGSEWSDATPSDHSDDSTARLAAASNVVGAKSQNVVGAKSQKAQAPAGPVQSSRPADPAPAPAAAAAAAASVPIKSSKSAKRAERAQPAQTAEPIAVDPPADDEWTTVPTKRR